MGAGSLPQKFRRVDCGPEVFSDLQHALSVWRNYVRLPSGATLSAGVAGKTMRKGITNLFEWVSIAKK